jgi:hypothetical protein
MQLATDMQRSFESIVLLGDFNLNIDWSDVPIAKDNIAREFVTSFSDLFLEQLVKHATRVTASSRKILDLVLCNSSENVANLSIIPGISDHFAVTLSLNTSLPSKIIPPLRSVYNSKRVNWDNLRQCFHLSLPSNFDKFYSVILMHGPTGVIFFMNVSTSTLENVD